MAADINDKFTEATNGSRPVPTTLTAILASGASPGTATCGALTGWPTATAVHFIIYTVDVNGNKVSGSQTDWKGIVSGSNITGLTLKAGTNNGYSIGAIVEAAPTAAWADDVTEGIAVEHNQDGTHKNTLVGMLAGTQTFTGNKTFSGLVEALLLKTNTPQGFMINGKIVTSVAANDLTVEIKTLAGNNPSASDPVYIRIGNSVRTVTAALSKTLNDGTNWFGSGNTTLATTELDYFVYLCWNTTDSAVTMAFSRIPSGRTYASFSTTQTVKNYWAGTGSAPASTDEVENIGRFNATLSATAAFNWSIPATSIIINRPCFESRIFSFTNTGTLGGTFYWQIRGDDVHLWGTSGSVTTTAIGPKTFTLTIPTSIFTTMAVAQANTWDLTSYAEQYSHMQSPMGINGGTIYTINAGGAAAATAKISIVCRGT